MRIYIIGNRIGKTSFYFASSTPMGNLRIVLMRKLTVKHKHTQNMYLYFTVNKFSVTIQLISINQIVERILN